MQKVLAGELDAVRQTVVDLNRAGARVAGERLTGNPDRQVVDAVAVEVPHGERLAEPVPGSAGSRLPLACWLRKVSARPVARPAPATP